MHKKKQTALLFTIFRCECKRTEKIAACKKGSILVKRVKDGELAQLGERLLCTQEVSGSIPLFSTRFKKAIFLPGGVKATKWQRA